MKEVRGIEQRNETDKTERRKEGRTQRTIANDLTPLILAGLRLH